MGIGLSSPQPGAEEARGVMGDQLAWLLHTHCYVRLSTLALSLALALALTLALPHPHPDP